MENEKELDAFLKKVDDIKEIISGLKSTDKVEQDDASARADELIQKEKVAANTTTDHTGFSRTQINNVKDDPPVYPDIGESNPEAFMRVMECDAQERAKRKKERQKEADKLRLEGNSEFKSGNYQKANDIYTEALSKIKDDTRLYTNRAQSHIKLGRYEEALVDCDWALRVDDKCVKAMIHQGHAHLALERFNDARCSYQSAMDLDSKKSSLVKDYLQSVDRAESAKTAELRVANQLELGVSEVTDVCSLLEKISHDGQPPAYYSGAFLIITSYLVTDTQRTVFRMKGGLQLLSRHLLLKRCLEAQPDQLSQDHIQLISDAIYMAVAACKQNDKNAEDIFDCNPNLAQQLMKVLYSTIAVEGPPLKENILLLLQVVSETEIGQTKIIAHMEISRLVAFCFSTLKHVTLGGKGMQLLTNFSENSKFKSLIRGDLEEIMISHLVVLLKDDNICTISALPSCLSLVVTLSCDRPICQELGKSKHLWDAVTQCLKNTSHGLLHKVIKGVTLGLIALMINVCQREASSLAEHVTDICNVCWDIYETKNINSEIKQHCLQLMSAFVVRFSQAEEITCRRETFKHFTETIQLTDSPALLFAIKGLAACSRDNINVCQCIVECKGSLSRLVSLVNHPNESIVGNAALCLDHCTRVQSLGKRLLDTDIIKDLLIQTSNSGNESVRQNCGILISKLCQTHNAYRERLRDLHGLEFYTLLLNPTNSECIIL